MARKQKKYHFIYRTTCVVTGKFYVGMHSTDDLQDGYIGSGKILGYSIRKYGRENHKLEILEMCGSRDELKTRERQIVNEQLLADALNINLRYGGEGGWEHLNFRNTDPEWKTWRDWRASLIPRDAQRRGGLATGSMNFENAHATGKIRYDTFLGKTHTVETRQKISEGMKGKQQGKNNSQFHTCWVTKDSVTIKIKKQHLAKFLSDGYTRGRKS